VRTVCVCFVRVLISKCPMPSSPTFPPPTYPTPPQVHLNFPTIVTTEARARRTRKAVINRCRTELAGLPALELLKVEIAAAQAAERAQRELEELVAEEARLRAMAAQLRGESGSSDGSSDGSSSSSGAAEDAGAPAAGAASSSGSGGGGGGGGGGGAAEEAREWVVAAAPLDPLLTTLDWEGIIDVPHGSLRLPGSYKAPWMDRDPEWVLSKVYSPVTW
jgi:hypothetical protein